MKPSGPQGNEHVARSEPMDELDEVFAVVARHFGLLSEPTRLKILHAICQQEKSGHDDRRLRPAPRRPTSRATWR